MSLRHEAKNGLLVPDITNPREPTPKDLTRSRLLAVYRFGGEKVAQKIGIPSLNHLDVGTSDGFALPTIADWATNITSLDIDAEMLWHTQQRPELEQLLKNSRLKLVQMDARFIQVPPDTFNSATIIEVFGAGLRAEGNKEPTRRDVMRVFEGAQRALTPDGVLIFTIKSKTGYDVVELIGWPGLEKGIVLDQESMDNSLKRLFRSVEWYGQLPIRDTENGLIVPGHLSKQRYKYDPSIFVPRKLNEGEVPIFWVGVCQK